MQYLPMEMFIYKTLRTVFRLRYWLIMLIHWYLPV